jgi:hypothetical protein
VKKNTGPARTNKIDNKGLNDELLPFLIHAVTCETYLIHSNVARIGRFEKQNLLTFCGRIRETIRSCGPPPESILGLEVSVEHFASRRAKIGRLEVLKNNLDLDTIERLPLTCNPVILLETLLSNVKNEVISHQVFIKRAKNEKIVWLKKKLAEVKSSENPDCDEINNLERKLDSIMDSDMRSDLEKYRYFELLNSEKMTPRFLSLAKKENKTISITQICDDTGTAFTSANARTEYIRNFFQKIYKAPDPGDILDENCIQDFLGDEICANPIVTDSKLTNDESLFFEQELTVQELDAAIQQINSKSAGGSDGISTIFLRQYWSFFRKPFTLYANHCFGNGTISPMFNSASIRLIPKKGDTKLMKNWRPISLLNVGFKIISKAIDNRLKKCPM